MYFHPIDTSDFALLWVVLDLPDKDEVADSNSAGPIDRNDVRFLQSRNTSTAAPIMECTLRRWRSKRRSSQGVGVTFGLITDSNVGTTLSTGECETPPRNPHYRLRRRKARGVLLRSIFVRLGVVADRSARFSTRACDPAVLVILARVQTRRTSE